MILQFLTTRPVFILAVEFNQEAISKTAIGEQLKFVSAKLESREKPFILVQNEASETIGWLPEDDPVYERLLGGEPCHAKLRKRMPYNGFRWGRLVVDVTFQAGGSKS